MRRSEINEESSVFGQSQDKEERGFRFWVDGGSVGKRKVVKEGSGLWTLFFLFSSYTRSSLLLFLLSFFFFIIMQALTTINEFFLLIIFF